MCPLCGAQHDHCTSHSPSRVKSWPAYVDHDVVPGRHTMYRPGGAARARQLRYTCTAVLCLMSRKYARPGPTTGLGHSSRIRASSSAGHVDDWSGRVTVHLCCILTTPRTRYAHVKPRPVRPRVAKAPAVGALRVPLGLSGTGGHPRARVAPGFITTHHVAPGCISTHVAAPGCIASFDVAPGCCLVLMCAPGFIPTHAAASGCITTQSAAPGCCPV